MPSSLLPRFVLKPWEFAGAPHSPFADAVVSCEWNGHTISMRLKVRENLLFFSPEGDDEVLFVCAEPLADSTGKAQKWRLRADRLEKWFRLALEHEWWARVILLPPLVSQTQQTPVVALVKRDGVGWIRRLYEDDSHAFWLDWSAEDVHLKGRFEEWPTEPLTEDLCNALGSCHKEVLELRASQSASERAGIPMNWLRGDKAQLSLLVEKSIILFQDFTLLEAYSGAQLNAECSIACATVLQRESLKISFGWKVDQSGEVAELFSLFCRLHLAVGQTLDHLGTITPTRWHISARRPDSQHERLEAMMQLRDAVRGTSIEREVGEILARVQ